MKIILQVLTVIFFVLLIVFTSWLVIHILALFGIFLAIFYPFWSAILPKFSGCIMCMSKKDGEMCPFCRQIINKGETIAPKHFLSGIYNALVILALTIASISLVFFEYKLLSYLGVVSLQKKTVSFVVPPKDQYKLNEVFPMQIMIANIKTPINTIQADFKFDADKLEVIDISTDNSFATVFIQREIDNDNGFVRLAGGIPNPGYSESSGLFGTAYFRCKKHGIAQVEYLPSSMVLANDARGTNILKDFSKMAFMILPEQADLSRQAYSPNPIPSMGAIISDAEGDKQTRMTFYDKASYDETRVLGDTSDTEVAKPERISVSVIERFRDFVASFDTFVVDFWFTN